MVLTKDLDTTLLCPSEWLVSFLSYFHVPVEGCFSYISHNFLLTIPTDSDWALFPLPSLGPHGPLPPYPPLLIQVTLMHNVDTQFFNEDEQDKFLQYVHIHQD